VVAKHRSRARFVYAAPDRYNAYKRVFGYQKARR
jgi:hypothetical protein